jgi:formylmethanofuran dehydrogenase subunit E-like metal-binding protein
MQHSIDAFEHHASVYGQYNASECEELEEICKYIAELTKTHTINLKVDTVQRFKQQITKYLKVNNASMSALQQILCTAREAAASEFERKEKGKYTCTIVE